MHHHGFEYDCGDHRREKREIYATEAEGLGAPWAACAGDTEILDALVEPTAKKKGRPGVDSEAVNVRIERALLDRLDTYIVDSATKRLSRQQTIRRALAEWLSVRGLLPKTATLPPAR